MIRSTAFRPERKYTCLILQIQFSGFKNSSTFRGNNVNLKNELISLRSCKHNTGLLRKLNKEYIKALWISPTASVVQTFATLTRTAFQVPSLCI